jgi:methenyltetrahydrofolate cyclohydrolase
LTDATLAAFLDDLAADPPGPAGGSAAAVTVAMAAALIELAARRSDDGHRAANAAELRRRAFALAEADARAYEQVLDSHGEERRSALTRASGVLEEIAAAAHALNELAQPLIDRARPPLAADVRAAVELAGAARAAVGHLALANARDAGGDTSSTKRKR